MVMSDVTLLKIASISCTSTNLFNRYGKETNSVYAEFLEQLMKSYRKSKRYECQNMADKVEDELHFESLHQFILNLAIL
jgi:hypothetical protein